MDGSIGRCVHALIIAQMYSPGKWLGLAPDAEVNRCCLLAGDRTGWNVVRYKGASSALPGEPKSKRQREGVEKAFCSPRRFDGGKGALDPSARFARSG